MGAFALAEIVSRVHEELMLRPSGLLCLRKTKKSVVVLIQVLF